MYSTMILLSLILEQPDWNNGCDMNLIPSDRSNSYYSLVGLGCWGCFHVSFFFVLKVKTSVWNLYQQICRRQNMPLKLEERETEQQLIHIKHTIRELEKVVCTARRHASKEAASNVANPSSTQKWREKIVIFTAGNMIYHHLFNTVTGNSYWCIIKYMLPFCYIAYLFPSAELIIHRVDLLHAGRPIVLQAQELHFWDRNIFCCGSNSSLLVFTSEQRWSVHVNHVSSAKT